MDLQFTTLGALIGLVVAILLIIKKVQPAYGLILGALIGGLIGGRRPRGHGFHDGERRGLHDVLGAPHSDQRYSGGRAH